MEHSSSTILHRSILSVVPQILFGFALAFACAMTIDQHFPGLKIPLGADDFLRLPLWPLVFAVFVVRPFAMILDGRHEITAHHVRSELGRFSLRREAIEIPFEHLKGVRVDQSFWERMLDVGTVIGWTGIPGSPDLAMHGLHRPDKIAKIIAAKIDEMKILGKS